MRQIRLGNRLNTLRNTTGSSLHNMLHRGLPANAHIVLRQRLPLVMLAISLLGELLLPDPIWVILIVTLGLLHVFGFLWVRSLAGAIGLERNRSGLLLVVDDEFEEDFRLRNKSIVPLLWVEVREQGTLPGYNPGRVVACTARGETRWRTSAICSKRGLFQLGPLTLASGDPFRLFTLSISFLHTEPILIYPRVVQLPTIPLPVGHADADARVHRSLSGALPAPTVREHQPSEGLRHIHWHATAHHGRLMVREREQEPAGDLIVLLDLCLPPEASDWQEFAVSVAASAAAQILAASARRKTGLLTTSGDPPELIHIRPDHGQAHIWRILAALAPLRASTVPLATLLRESRPQIGANSTLVVVTSALAGSESIYAWCAELIRTARRGVRASVMVIGNDATAETTAIAMALLAEQSTPAMALSLDTPLAIRPMIRRTRRVVKSTPTGGSFSFEVEEEVS